MPKKFWLILLIAAILVLTLQSAALANTPEQPALTLQVQVNPDPGLELIINNMPVPKKNVNPILVGDTTYVPLETLSLLKGVIAIDNEKGAGIAIKNSPGYYWICSLTRHDKPVPPPAAFVYNGKTYIPLRHWAEFFGATVTYEDGKIYVQQ
ncbi:hypothetical protein MHLNE_15780 [Moorella humiferrea]|uniref:hypothetical protein n=1 Tax=Neomoorella humiferrea TaxID=676965 RepID=UPI0030CA63CB